MLNTLWQCDVKHIIGHCDVKHIIGQRDVKHIRAVWCETHYGSVMWNTLWQCDVKHIMAAWCETHYGSVICETHYGSVICETHYGSVMWNTLWQCDVKHIMAVWYVKHIMALPIKATMSVLKVPTYYYHSLSYLTHCDTSDNIHLDLHKYSYSIFKWSLIFTSISHHYSVVGHIYLNWGSIGTGII
jgi:hypothetical protein